jgi:hypothetical protein
LPLITSDHHTTTSFRYDGGTNFQELSDFKVTNEFIRAGNLDGGIGSVLCSLMKRWEIHGSR